MKLLRIPVMLVAVLQFSGCYYLQAARGHMDIMNKRRPVDDIISDTESPAELRKKLSLVNEARQFSIDELHLPDNDSYRSYADLERDFVVWNVFAAPEFSLQSKTWCYPVAGCVSYRGYFSKDAAERQAEKLESQGYDVVVAGVTAYSTLGRFSDPVLNTMLRWNDVELIAVLFHELAHQQLYIKNDSEFNESFASAVEEVGVERWLARHGELERLSEYKNSRGFRRGLMQLVEAARTALKELYASAAGENEKRRQKRAILDDLKSAAEREAEASGRRRPAWLASELNNASLIPLSLYQGRLDEFRELLIECNEDLRCFYDKAELLSRN
jgi:predicted aminopeptidase